MNSDANDSRAQPISLRRRVFSIPTFLSFGVAAALIFSLATSFDIDWGVMWDNVQGMNLWLYVLAFVTYYLSFAVRGLRWRILARNAGVQGMPGARLPTVLQCSRLIIMGWFVNSITWLRLGDAYRAYAFSEESNGKFSWSLGTVLAERVLDMATVSAMLVFGVLFLTITTDAATLVYVLVAAAIMVFALVIVMLLMKGYGKIIARLLPGRLESHYLPFHQGALGSFKQLPVVAALGVAGWGLETACLYLVVQALDLNVALALVPVAAMGHAMLSTVPTPGGVGFVEPGLTGLLLISLARNDAVSVVLLDRSITYASVIVVGGLIFLIRQVNQARRRRQLVVTERRAGT